MKKIALRTTLVLLLGALGSMSTLAAPEAYKQKNKQTRAHQLTVDMISTVLTTQLKQLEDNRLTDDPLYSDLKEMNARLDSLAAEHMNEVVDILTTAIDAPEAQRADLMKDARGRMQQILDRLLYERDLLRQRRMEAALTAHVRIMISKQESTRTTTLGLKNASEEAIISAAGSQTEIDALFTDYQSLLDSVSSWSGELGAIGSEAKRLLSESGIEDALAQASEALLATRFDPAAEHQQRVLEGLTDLLRAIRQLEDPASIEEDMVDAVTLLLEMQEEIRTAAQTADLDNDEEMEPLLEQQNLLVQKLGRLAGVVAISDRMETLSTMAEEQADLAASTLFEADKALAIGHQNKVTGALAEMLVELQNWAGRLDKFLTAEEYHALYEMLTAVRKDLHGTIAAHEQKDLKQVSTTLAKITADPKLPRFVWLRVRNAEEAVKASQVDTEKLNQSDRAIRYAIGEVTETQNQAHRNAMAVELGELNRGTESLLRASAAARRTADVLDQWGSSATESVLAQSAVVIEKVRAIADRVAEGVSFTAPQAVDALNELAAPRSPESVTPEAFRSLAWHIDAPAGIIREDMYQTATNLEASVLAELVALTHIEVPMNRMAADDEKTPPNRTMRELADQSLTQSPAIGAALHDGADVAPEADDLDKLTRRQLNRARVLADIKREELEELLALAQLMKRIAEKQLKTAEKIAKLQQPPGEPKVAEIEIPPEPPESQPPPPAPVPEPEPEVADVPEPEPEPMPDPEIAVTPPPPPPESQTTPEPMPEPETADAPEPQATPEPEPAAQPDPLTAEEQAEADATAEAIADAAREQALATVELGEAVQDLTGEQDIANAPIAEAVQIAETLAPPQTEESASSSEGGEGGEGGESQDGSTPAPASDAASAAPEAADGAPESADSGDAPADSGSEGEGAAPAEPVSFVPDTQALLEALGASAGPPGEGEGQSEGGGEGEGEPAAGPGPGEEAADAPPEAPGVGESPIEAGKMSEEENIEMIEGDAELTAANPDGDSQTDELRDGDAQIEEQERGRGTWNTALPPGVQESMRSGRRVKLPRAYEGRLKKYFESLK